MTLAGYNIFSRCYFISVTNVFSFQGDGNGRLFTCFSILMDLTFGVSGAVGASVVWKVQTVRTQVFQNFFAESIIVHICATENLHHREEKPKSNAQGSQLACWRGKPKRLMLRSNVISMSIHFPSFRPLCAESSTISVDSLPTYIFSLFFAFVTAWRSIASSRTKG